jgi:hypothetical protein
MLSDGTLLHLWNTNRRWLSHHVTMEQIQTNKQTNKQTNSYAYIFTKFIEQREIPSTTELPDLTELRAADGGHVSLRRSLNTRCPRSQPKLLTQRWRNRHCKLHVPSPTN